MTGRALALVGVAAGVFLLAVVAIGFVDHAIASMAPIGGSL